MFDEFPKRIRWMNQTFELPVNTYPVLLSKQQLINFRSILTEEIKELDSIIDEYEETTEISKLVALADLLGDLVVYIYSEALKHGLPLADILDLIMDSQESKLEDGKPIRDERGKFLKGRNYCPPESKIEKLLQFHIKRASVPIRELQDDDAIQDPAV